MKDIDLKLTVLFTLICIPFVFLTQLNETPIRIILGLPLLLFLPGYSFIAALFPTKYGLDESERVSLSFGMSIAVVSLIGLALNYTPFGIRLNSVFALISTFIISLSFIAWIRRMKLPAQERFSIPFNRLLKVNIGQSVLDKGLSIVLIASIIFSSATLVYVVVKPKTDERFTDFYILGPNGKASDYPINLAVGEEGKVIIGIINQEYENVTYLLEVNFNGSSIYKEYVFLIENEKLEIPFTFKAIEKGEYQKLKFIIYKNQQREAYRTLHLWINIT